MRKGRAAVGAYGSEAPAQDLRGRPTKAADSEEEEETHFREELKKWKRKDVRAEPSLSFAICRSTYGYFS